MPSTPRSTARRTVPWFLDALRWTRRLCPAGDRDTIELVRLDVEDELNQLLAEGVSRRKAYGQIWRRIKVECGFFWPRAGAWWKGRAKAAVGRVRGVGRRMVKPALGVGLAGIVLLSAKWLWFDATTIASWDDAAMQLAELRREMAEVRSTEAAEPGRPLSAEAQSAIARLAKVKSSFERAREDTSEPFLLGMMGLIDEELAQFWEARGDETRSASHWRAALSLYAEGAAEGDPIALMQLGNWQRGHVGPREALVNLRQAYQRWGVLGTERDQDPGYAMVEAEYHYALLELWKAEHDPSIVFEALPLEEQALRDLARGKHRAGTLDILYNAACLRALLIQDGVQLPDQGSRAIEFLHLALEAAGESRESFARSIVSDSDLAALRELPAYAGIAAKAKAVLSDTPSERESGNR